MSSPIKDDDSRDGKIAYDILFVMFLVLAVMGTCNIYFAIKTCKFKNKSILTFYISSLAVIVLRIVLFTDQWEDYPWNYYVILLITLPTFLYLITGLSQVMLSVGCIIKYRDLSLDENPDLTPEQKRTAQQKNKLILTVLYVVIAVLMLSIVVLFCCWAGYCTIEDGSRCTFNKAASLTLEIAIFNLVVWALLVLATLSFYDQIKGRFNGKSFKCAVAKLFLYLTLFSLSFGLRGTWDLYQSTKNSGMPKSEMTQAWLVFIIYFFCEWLPIFAIYLIHLQDFRAEFKMMKTAKKEISRENETDESLFITEPIEKEHNPPGWMILSPKKIGRKYFVNEFRSSTLSYYKTDRETDAFTVNNMLVNSSDDLGLKGMTMKGVTLNTYNDAQPKTSLKMRHTELISSEILCSSCPNSEPQGDNLKTSLADDCHNEKTRFTVC